ncbi:MAG: hypothetical protein IJM24_03470 [Clostridia bacterium]|nr:hypothetical protein [Clostridia bacterium]
MKSELEDSLIIQSGGAVFVCLFDIKAAFKQVLAGFDHLARPGTRRRRAGTLLIEGQQKILCEEKRALKGILILLPTKTGSMFHFGHNFT